MPIVRCATVTIFFLFLVELGLGQSPPDHAMVQTFKAAPSYFIANTAHQKTGKKLVEDDEVVAFVQTQQGRVLFTSSGAYIGMAVAADDPIEPIEHRAHKMDPLEFGRDFSRPMKTVVMKVGFDAQRAKKRNILPRLEDKTNHIVSFFLGSQENWQTGLPTYRKLVYENVWHDIDLEYLAYQDHLEFQIIVKPGADPSTIVMETGAERIDLNENGRLIAYLGTGILAIGKPFAYQLGENGKNEIGIESVAKHNGSFTFALEDYNPNQKLIIDPSLLWSTFLGGGGGDGVEAGQDIVVDGQNNAFIIGYSPAADFPTVTGSFDVSWNGGISDVFVTKVNDSGSDLFFSTFVGGSAQDIGSGIAVDETGNAYLTGYTASSDFPTTIGAYAEIHSQKKDAFVCKLNNDGTDISYSTLLGGIDDDFGRKVVLDDLGNAILTGQTYSVDFPTTTGAYDETYNFGGDAFVCKVNSSGSDLIFSTFLGGSGVDDGLDIAADGDGNTFVAGSTSSSSFPTSEGAYDETYNEGIWDGFLTKLNDTGTDLVYSSFVGGQSADHCCAIALDASGNAYLVGHTSSVNFPTTAGAYDQTHNGDYDVFAMKIDSAGSGLVFSTFVGGNLAEYCTGIALDALGNVYITGWTESDSFPATPGAYDEIFNGANDVIFCKLNGNASSLLYSSFLGGSSDEFSHGIAIDNAECLYLTGETNSPDFPTTAGAYDREHSGPSDVFVTKVNAVGSGLDYSTFLGGSGHDNGRGIAVDDGGSVYVSGATWSHSFPSTSGVFDETFNGSWDAYVCKFDSNGVSLTYSSFLGGSDDDYSTDIVVDGSGNVHLTGSTWSESFPTTSGAFDENYNGADDVFISKLDASGAQLMFSTYLGTDLEEYGAGIALDDTGDVFLTGHTYSNVFPTTDGAFDETHNGDADVFLTKLDNSGSGLVFSTFIGGAGKDRSTGISVDDSSNAFVTGSTRSADFPTTSGVYDPIYNGASDVFVSNIAASGAELLYSTFIGGSSFESASGIVVDDYGNAYITGYTISDFYPTTPGAFDETHNDGSDVFVTKLDSNGANLIYSTFLAGNNSYDDGKCIAVDTHGNSYISGYTQSSLFPTTPFAFDDTYNGEYDVFVTKLDATGSDLSYSSYLGGGGSDIGLSIAITDSGTVYVTGYTKSNNFPTTSGAFNETQNGYGDAFVASLDLFCFPLASASVSGDTSICGTQSTSIMAELAGTPPWNLTWSDGSYYPSVTESPLIHVVNPTVTTTYSITQIGDTNCWGTSTGYATVFVADEFEVGTLPRTSVAQGLVLQTFEAFAMCDTPSTEFEWTIPATSYSFGIDVNPITLDPIPTETTDYQIRVTDQSARATLYHTVRLLVAVDGMYLDLNEDGYNNVADIWALCDDWRTERPMLDDPNGDGIVEILDYLYLNLDDPYPCPAE